MGQRGRTAQVETNQVVDAWRDRKLGRRRGEVEKAGGEKKTTGTLTPAPDMKMQLPPSGEKTLQCGPVETERSEVAF